MHIREAFTWDSVVRARYTIGGVVSLIVGLGFTVALAYWASAEEPPSGSQSLLFVVLSSVFQLSSVLLFGRGRPSKTSVQIAVRHLVEIGQNVVTAKQVAEAAQDGTVSAKAAVGELSVRLSGVEDQIASSIQDWIETHEIANPAINYEETQ